MSMALGVLLPSLLKANFHQSSNEILHQEPGKSCCVAMHLRNQFVTDIVILIRELQQQGHEVVLMTDLNEASGFMSTADKLCYECNLADAHALAGLSNPPPTYHRGSAKIDFVLISASLVNSVRAPAIMALHDGYLSDHRALLVDFDVRSMFLSNTSPITQALD
jgi:endonuclease/exonuclease/phosphatase family metal-dependent hydrolase